MPPITKKIDIWALGVTFYCLLFGKPPWHGGENKFNMFYAICWYDFELPDTMCRDRVPTGGKDRKPEGEEVGWYVVELLERLLEKDQEKRIALAVMKVCTVCLRLSLSLINHQRIPWIQNGVRDPERWIQETTPSTDTRVIITDEDAKGAIKSARFYYPGWISRITSTIKRVPLPLLPHSRASSRGVPLPESKTSTSSSQTKGRSQTESLGRARSSHTRAVMDRQLKRFTFVNSSPIRSNTLPPPRDRRRNSAGTAPPHTQSISDPSGHIDHRHDLGPSSRRSTATYTTSSGSQSQMCRRKSDSLQLPESSCGSISPTPSPTTPEEEPVTSSRLKLRLSQVIRSNSVRKAVQGVRRGRSRRTDKDPSLGRTSAETLDVLRFSEDLGLTPAMRASSWGSPSAQLGDDDGRVSFDLTVSEAGASGVHDFNRSVVRFGAGGYVDSPTALGPAPSVYQPLNAAAGPSGSGRHTAAGMSQSDSSSNSTATAATPQQHADSPHPHLRVTSPLAREHESSAEEAEAEEDEEAELSSDVFEDTGDDGDGPNSSEEDILELRTRRPSTILSRSANTSPLR